MSHCPQAVALAVLLQAEAEAGGRGRVKLCAGVGQAASVPAPGQVTGGGMGARRWGSGFSVKRPGRRSSEASSGVLRLK